MDEAHLPPHWGPLFVQQQLDMGEHLKQVGLALAGGGFPCAEYAPAVAEVIRSEFAGYEGPWTSITVRCRELGINMPGKGGSGWGKLADYMYRHYPYLVRPLGNYAPHEKTLSEKNKGHPYQRVRIAPFD